MPHIGGPHAKGNKPRSAAKRYINIFARLWWSVKGDIGIELLEPKGNRRVGCLVLAWFD